MSQNRWLATGNYYTTYREEQRLFTSHLDRTIFALFLATLFIWPSFFQLSNNGIGFYTAGPFDGFPSDFQYHPLLGIHFFGFAPGNAEKTGIKQIDMV